MIIYSCLIRCLDGMPLSATNAFGKEVEFSVEKAKNAIKMLIKKMAKIPSKLCIEDEIFTIHCIKDDSTCFFVVCNTSYPHILAYSFLDELKKEFLLLYTPSVVNAVKRPYGFIEFDSYLHKVQQKYNSPRTLASRLDLSELTNDINMNPPQYKKLSDFESLPLKKNDQLAFKDDQMIFKKPAELTSSPNTLPISNGFLPANDNNNTTKYNFVIRMKPLPWYGRMALLLYLPCMAIDIYRGTVNIQSAIHLRAEEDAGLLLLHGIAFYLELLCLSIQRGFMQGSRRWRKLVNLSCCLLVLLLNFFVYDIRELIIVVGYVSVSLLFCIATLRRTVEKCLPNYSI